MHHNAPGPGSVLGALQRNGYIGVDIFLILSSFLISTLLLIEYERKGGISLLRFYSRRVLRIWPLLFLALCLNYLALPTFNYFQDGLQNPLLLHDLKFHGIPNLMLLGNWSVAFYGYTQYGYVDHLWTISLEQQFYLLWPLLLTFVAGKPRQFALWCSALILISFIARFYYISVRLDHPALWVSTITRMDPLAFGGILALLYRRRNQKTKGTLRTRSLLRIAIFVAALYSIIVILHQVNWTGDAWWKIGVTDLCIAIAIGCVLNSLEFARIMRFRPIVWLGKISYGLYVYHTLFIHSPLSGQVRDFSARIFGIDGQTIWTWSLGILLNSAILVAVSAISFYCFERLFLKFKERFEAVASRPA